MTNAKNVKEFEERFSSSRVGGGPNLSSPSRNDYGDGKFSSRYTSPHALSLVPAGGGGNIGSYRNTNASNLANGGGAPAHDKRAPQSVKKVLERSYFKLGYIKENPDLSSLHEDNERSAQKLKQVSTYKTPVKI